MLGRLLGVGESPPHTVPSPLPGKELPFPVVAYRIPRSEEVVWSLKATIVP